MKSTFLSALVGAVTVGLAGAAGAAPQILVTGDLTLQGDVVFSDADGAGLVVGAPGITIDLNGYSIRCVDGGPLSDCAGIDNSAGHDDVTIRNGTIDNGGWGVLAVDADRLTLEDLTITGAGWYQQGGRIIGAVGIAVEHGQDLAVSGVSLSDGVYGFWLVSTFDARIEGVQASGCGMGGIVSSCYLGGPSCPGGQPGPGATGKLEGCDLSDNYGGLVLEDTPDFTVESSTFERNSGSGIRIGYSSGVAPSGVRIEGNRCSRNGNFGILALALGPTGVLPIDDLEIEDNTISKNLFGIALVQVMNSLIAGNSLQSNSDFGLVLFEQSAGNLVKENTATGHGRWGIALIPILNDFSRPGPTNNELSGNTALRNGWFDLFHTVGSTPNTWTGNTYKTSQGGDIQ